MADTRAQPAAQRGREASRLQPQGNEPTASHQRRSSQTNLPRQHCTTPDTRGPKWPADAWDHDTPRKLRRQYPSNPRVETANRLDPIEFWATEGHWPQEYFDPGMERILAQKRPQLSLGRKRSHSATSSTPSDQRPREEKSASYGDPRYETLLETKGSFMTMSDLDVTTTSKTLCQALLESPQAVPENSLFRDEIFVSTCQKIRNRHEARVIRDIGQLIVPSAENLATLGAKHLDTLIDSVNEGWNNSIPLTGTRPQPDYAVGFRRGAFNNDRLAKLSPVIGDFIGGDLSLAMATYYMYFPFLSCEVKCGASALDIADRQNAHSMTLAVRATVELFRAVERENEVHRQILAFSISHDDQLVRIYGHYAMIDGKDTKYYRYPIRKFDFTELDGKEKWTAYRFTKNVYDSWVPMHFKRLCSAIDQLPCDWKPDDPPSPETGRSQSASVPGGQVATPGTSFTGFRGAEE